MLPTLTSGRRIIGTLTLGMLILKLVLGDFFNKTGDVHMLCVIHLVENALTSKPALRFK